MAVETKKPWMSRTIIAAVISFICGILVLGGIGKAESIAQEADVIADKVVGIIIAITSLTAIWGRIVAKKEIK